MSNSAVRFLSIAALLGARGAFAQNLPAPADVIPTTPVRATNTPTKPATPAKPAAPVVVITDSPSVPSTDDLLTQPPVRGSGSGSSPIILPDDSGNAVPISGTSSVGGVVVYGLTDVAALQKLKAAFDIKLQSVVTLSDDAKNYTMSRRELGATIPYRALLAQARTLKRDVPLRFSVELEAAKRAMTTLSAKVNRVENTAMSADNADSAVASGAVLGWTRVRMAIEGSAMRVKDALEAQPPRLNVPLVTSRTATTAPAVPGTSGPAAGAPAGFPHLLAEYSTHYDARIRGRTNNLRMAAKLVNGTIVPEGAVFSANKAIGPRNEEDGWKEAKMFVGGQVVSGIGSGICQCSSTVYNAALMAGLPILERHPHMFRVNYVPASRDAAIYWGSKDMRFRNESGGPLYVETFLSGGRFHARLWGTQPREGTYLVESRTISRKGGTVSEAYRISKTIDGDKRERLSRDVYRPHPD